MEFIPIYKPRISKNQKSYVLDCLDSNWISSRGKYIDMFENALEDYLGVSDVITTCNGSVSLTLILSALGIGFKDEVITQSLTYVATISSILNVGATPVLVDSDYRYQMNVELVEKAITTKTKAVMVAELYGDAPEILKLKKVCDDAGIFLIEDSAECFGCNLSTFNPDGYVKLSTRDRKVGTVGIAGSFSFFGNKVITTGEGGCVCTNDSDLADKLRLLKSQNHVGGFKHLGPAYNFRMTNIQAAIGLAQLQEIKEIIPKKKEISKFYRDNLSQRISIVEPQVNSSEWMPLFILPDTITYLKFQNECKARNIDTRPCFTPVHMMKGFNYKKGSKLVECERIYKSGFNLPSYPDLTNEELEYTVYNVNEIVDKIGD